ncbi:MAG: hypothetical protein AVDCRST_MAG54-246, partial [uncultured Actinomycetospora sp.]
GAPVGPRPRARAGRARGDRQRGHGAVVAGRGPRGRREPRRRRQRPAPPAAPLPDHHRLPRRRPARHRRRTGGLPAGGEPVARAGAQHGGQRGALRRVRPGAAALGRAVPLPGVRGHLGPARRYARDAPARRGVPGVRRAGHDPAGASRALARRPRRLRRRVGPRAGPRAHRRRRAGAPPPPPARRLPARAGGARDRGVADVLDHRVPARALPLVAGPGVVGRRPAPLRGPGTSPRRGRAPAPAVAAPGAVQHRAGRPAGATAARDGARL